MKYALSIFGILVLIIGSVLFFQFQVYSDQMEPTDGEFSYSQEIEIIDREDYLEIRHHYKNLPNRRISINWPEQIENLNCFEEVETSCNRLSEDLKEFKSGEIQHQSITYNMPLEGGLSSNPFLKDIFVTLKNGNVHTSTIHITTKSERNGKWITGLPLVGEESRSLVHYTMFSGPGPVKELYYHPDVKLQEQTELYSIYSKDPIPKELVKQLNEMNFIHNEHISIVHHSSSPFLQGERILFTKDLSIQSLQEDVILTQLHTKYQFKDSPNWVSEVLASFLTDTNIGGEKAQQLTLTLKNQMSESQLSEWKQLLKELKGKEISGPILDEQLAEVFGNKVEYFTANLQTDKVSSFYFIDQREVFVNSRLDDGVKVIFKDGQVFYSADELLTSLGYNVKLENNGYYVSGEIRQYRFPMGYDFFVYNQRRYNTLSDPLKRIDGQLFIEESWLQKIFFVEIEKKEDSISIHETT